MTMFNNTRVADKFVVRLPEGMRGRIADVARVNHRSMNSEIISRLESSFQAEGIEIDLDVPKNEGLTDDEQRLLGRFRQLQAKQQIALIELIAPALAKAS